VPDQADFVAVDLETTGLSPRDNEIIEVGAVKYRNGKPVAEFQELVRPRGLISGRITRLTGITNEMVAAARPIGAVMPDFLAFIDGYHLVIHNAPFDMGFLLANTAARINNPVFDTVPACREYFCFANNRLETVCRSLNIVNRHRHRALGDCLAVGQVYLECRKRYEAVNAVAGN
jgi:DNA polymerase III epsilon subunit family exonuclease